MAGQPARFGGHIMAGSDPACQRDGERKHAGASKALAPPPKLAVNPINHDSELMEVPAFMVDGCAIDHDAWVMEVPSTIPYV